MCVGPEVGTYDHTKLTCAPSHPELGSQVASGQASTVMRDRTGIPGVVCYFLNFSYKLLIFSLPNFIYRFLFRSLHQYHLRWILRLLHQMFSPPCQSGYSPICHPMCVISDLVQAINAIMPQHLNYLSY